MRLDGEHAGRLVVVPAGRNSRGWPVLRRILANPSAALGFGLMLLFLLLLVLGPIVATHDPYEVTPDVLVPPSSRHLFGTDPLGRDVFSRVILGLPYTMYAALATVALALSAGLLLGLLAGYSGGGVDNLVMRLCDLMFTFPPLLLAIAIMASLGPGLDNIVIAMAIVYTPQFARLIRGAVLTARQQDYVTAARGIGASTARILYAHILPNVMAPIIIQGTLSLSHVVLSESALSFLGLGAQPPAPSWGLMLSDARAVMELAPWVAVFPAAALVLLLLGLNLMGDGLRDLLDPRLRD